MTPNQKREIVSILQNAKGDDLYRAKLAFGNSNLDDKWGQSGKTKREILLDYQGHEDRINQLIKAVEAV